MFSPYYAWARRRGPVDPRDHCALNVALYGEGGKRWALTERRRGSLARDASSFAVGPSRLHWDGGTLALEFDEVGVPIPRRVRGRVRLTPAGVSDRDFALDARGGHRWWPLAPCAQIEVELDAPALRWRGSGYLDSNWGDEPLEDGFVRWHWSRAPLADGGAAVLYDVERRRGDRLSLAVRFAPDARPDDFAPPPRSDLPPTRWWRIARSTRADAGARVARTLEDTPFYARSVVASRLLGEDVSAVHESLSLDRFRAPWVQLLLPFRMPRRRR